MMRVLALDHGSARCGCALSDVTGTLATPIGVVERPDTRRGFGRVVALVRERQADRVIVGLPLTLAGEEGQQAAAARAFADRLAQRLESVPVELVDERLTTVEAERRGGRAGADARAAAVLLEAELERTGVRG
jgi:putative Holliday junction resolvase